MVRKHEVERKVPLRFFTMEKQMKRTSKKRTKRRRKTEQGGGFLLWLAAVTCILLGAAIFLYPFISNYFAEKEQNKVIDVYQARVDDTSMEEREVMWEEAKTYNENIAGDPVHDPFMVGSGYAVPDNYEEVLDMGDGVMCYLKIPKLDINLPVYHGTSEAVLKKGVGHLEMTALPIGGENRRAVLTGHRGLPQAELFTRLDEMKLGDEFYIYILDEIHAYKVKEIKTVKPETLQDLTIMPQGEDLITLVTCTPYGMNTHRLLITGERTEYVSEKENKAQQNSLVEYLMPWRYYLFGTVAAAIILVVVGFVRKMIGNRKSLKRRRAKRAKRKKR